MTKVMLIFSLIGALDRIAGNRLGIGKEFEKGFLILGHRILSMVGMIVISPWIAQAISPVLDFMWERLRIDPSIIPAVLFANDMGGAELATKVSRIEGVGQLNALVVSATMGAAISFHIPYSLGVVKKEQQKWLLPGVLCGIAMIPLGCLAAGVVLRIPVALLIYNLLPLLLLSAVVVTGLIKFPAICVRIFGGFGVLIRTIITIGLAIGIAQFVLGKQLDPRFSTFEDGASIAINASIVMSGAFPLLYILSKILKKPLHYIGKKIGMNETSAIGFLSTLATGMVTFTVMDKMDDKGVMLNSAFVIPTSAVLAGHLAFTIAFDENCLPAVMTGKLVAGCLAIVLTNIVYKSLQTSDVEVNDCPMTRSED